MSTGIDAAALTECTAPLDDEECRALRRYWDQVIREEWKPLAGRRPLPVLLAEDSRRQRREARRAMARVVAAGRLARVHALPVAVVATATTSAGAAA
ncbi:MAG: hypothetical protein ACT4RN_20245 [Pseudonocardia sp.]